ncbi:tRNA (adenosine(37)-N6)-dimethylallyltransferase MiaA [Nitratireductor sp. GISD-1A_MAKvit]|uniref:tRNA (adenosine(37)-N6)-dimethylallyltransferase MiaA n=1 Tax=Nitratireductor sp. GISD-1A_MAKvit TaxID=3234198 RepID=UPI00346693A4
MLNDAILIAGPTASGKSALAVDIARKTGGVVINADSMQVYDVLSVLSARPGPDDLNRVPHALYGHVPPSVAYSTGAWLADVAQLCTSGFLQERRPIFVGGTGLYFRALLEGIAKTPAVPPKLRRRWRERLVAEGPEALHRILQERDPEAAASIGQTDGQRITRALEVHEASGRPLSEWQKENTPPLVSSATSVKVVLEPDRSFVVERIERRFDRMIAQGGLEEVRALLSLKLAPELPAMKAIGVRELASYLQGEIPLAQAVEQAKTATRRYSKRQTTWFRHQLDDGWKRLAVTPSDATQVRLVDLVVDATKN